MNTVEQRVCFRFGRCKGLAAPTPSHTCSQEEIRQEIPICAFRAKWDACGLRRDCRALRLLLHEWLYGESVQGQAQELRHSKGTIRFQRNKTLPPSLVRRRVNARIAAPILKRLAP